MYGASRVLRYNWYRYRFPISAPQMDGPAPADAPTNMNATKSVAFIDPVDNSFPRSIRGSMTRPDVPDDQYVTNWHVCSESAINRQDLKPWTAYAPYGSFRFRPFNEFDRKGREYVQKMRTHARWQADPATGAPFREAFLSRMSALRKPEQYAAPSLSTHLDRLISEQCALQPWKSPLLQKRDVGRDEQPHPAARLQPAAGDPFPFEWKTEDWYEYETASVRLKRFAMTNDESTEVTYRIVLEALWEHHADRLADDISSFIGEIGKQVAEEKLLSVRSAIAALHGGSLDADTAAAFAKSRQPFHNGWVHYSDEEVKQFVLRELHDIEAACVKIINRCHIVGPRTSDPNVSWPVVEKLEPWVRMAEYWSSSTDRTFRELEKSTKHYEFRRYYRVVVAKLPFQSTEFERRMYDMRHWLHRSTSADFNTIYKKNIVHDLNEFPVEHDPVQKTGAEHHQLFSYALDWGTAPTDFAAEISAAAGDTWESIGARIGVHPKLLQDFNGGAEAPTAQLTVRIPPGSTKRPAMDASSLLDLTAATRADGTPVRTWEDAAAITGCSIAQLQELNPTAAAEYDVSVGFATSTSYLQLPADSGSVQFAAEEAVTPSDTFDSLAARLGTTASRIRDANPGVTDLHSVAVIRVPDDARTPRRISDHKLLPRDEAEALFTTSVAEAQQLGLPKDIPLIPANASKFPHEYLRRGHEYPAVPSELDATQSWAAYTVKYLDPELSSAGGTALPPSAYTVNPVWPYNQVPGKTDRQPFEEDQTWFLQHTPLQQRPMGHPDGHIQDASIVNNEQFPRSMEWYAP